MKLKKKPKKILITALVLIAVVAIAFVGYNIFFGKQEVKEAKVLKTIKKYGYTLKDNKTKRYQDMFEELDKILKKDPVDEEEYVKKISEMFIYDFYSFMVIWTRLGQNCINPTKINVANFAPDWKNLR